MKKGGHFDDRKNLGAFSLVFKLQKSWLEISPCDRNDDFSIKKESFHLPPFVG